MNHKIINIDSCDSLCNKTYSLKVFHSNIRSIHKNLELLLHTCDYNFFGILFLTESWTNSNSSLPFIDDYHLHCPSPLCTSHGGIVIYIKKSFTSTFTILSCNSLFQICSIFLPKQNTVIICSYRHPSHLYSDYITSLDNHITSSYSLNANNIILLGDMNIDITPKLNTKMKSSYLDIMHTNSYI